LPQAKKGKEDRVSWTIIQHSSTEDIQEAFCYCICDPLQHISPSFMMFLVRVTFLLRFPLRHRWFLRVNLRENIEQVGYPLPKALKENSVDFGGERRISSYHRESRSHHPDSGW